MTVKNVLLNIYYVPNQLPLGNVYTSISYFAELTSFALTQIISKIRNYLEL